MNSTNLLITGGCGFIGLNLMKFLIHKGYQNVRILDNLSIGTKESIELLFSELGTFTKKQSENQMNYSLDSSLLTTNSSLKSADSSPLTSPREIHDNEERSRFHRGPNFSLHSADTSLLTPNSSLNSRVELFIGDIRNKGDCFKATKGIDAVIHLAAHAGVIPSIEDPFFDFETNALGTLNLLRAAVKNNVNSFIFASSNAPLGDHDPPLNEGKIAKPSSPYGASKLSCEGYCSAFYGSYGLRTVILRFSNVYGPYCLHKQSVIAKFIKDGIAKGGLTIYGNGEQTRDFIHVDDLCHAIQLILDKSLAPHSSLLAPNSVWGEIFHLGTGKETPILGLAKLVKELFNRKITVSFAPERKGEIKRNYSDITKAKKILGFSPQIFLKEGTESVYKWFMNQGTDEIKEPSVLSGSE